MTEKTQPFTKEVADTIEEMLQNKELKRNATIKALLVVSTGPIPFISSFMLTLELIDTLLQGNKDQPEFADYIRTKLLTVISPK